MIEEEEEEYENEDEIGNGRKDADNDTETLLRDGRIKRFQLRVQRSHTRCKFCIVWLVLDLFCWIEEEEEEYENEDEIGNGRKDADNDTEMGEPANVPRASAHLASAARRSY
jgi:hypothetical protein